jgi:hypothetical protein
MSTAFYPLGMRTMPASGYNHHSSYEKKYITWKGSGVFSNPVGVTAGHIRPLTNNDPGNVFPTGFGLPRPLKHFRKGKLIRPTPIMIEDPNNPGNYIEDELINYNIFRYVKSSKGSSLGGGAGGFGLLNQMLDTPGTYVVKQNNTNEISNSITLNEECNRCEGVGIIDNYYPNTTYLTENPESNVENKVLCCNAEKKARRRVLPANTNLPKNYYTTHTQYMENRCQTYEQRVFNFQTPNPIKTEAISKNYYPTITTAEILAAKPGSALTQLNTYFANCQPNGEIYEATESALLDRLLNLMLNLNVITQNEYTEFQSLKIQNFDILFNYLNNLPEPMKTNSLKVFVNFINNPYWGMPLSGPSNPIGCKLVIYKPNNPQYAKQGAVSSSTRNLKLNVDTISTNAASFNRNNANLINSITSITTGINNNIPFILKNKASKCNNPPIVRYQNHKACYLNKEYVTPNVPAQNGIYVTQQPPFSSNHFSQSPNTYNTTHV